MDTSKKISLAVLCIDYRIWPQALPLLKGKYGAFDLIAMAGASKNLVSPAAEGDRIVLLENIATSIRLHNPAVLILTNHLDCGAYGGSKKFSSREEEIAFHQSELQKAKAVVNEKFPELPVITELLLMEEGNVSLM